MCRHDDADKETNGGRLDGRKNKMVKIKWFDLTFSD